MKSKPDSIQWLTGQYGVVNLIMGPYRLATDPHGAMNALYAAAPPDTTPGDAANDETTIAVMTPINDVPAPGTFV